MSNEEFRARPVTRHVVTKYTPPQPNVAGVITGASFCAAVGEFANEEQAEAVRAALEFQHAPREYVIVKSTYEPDTQALYAQSKREAEEILAAKTAAGETWRVFGRIKPN